jgi:hypothetical protein
MRLASALLVVCFPGALLAAVPLPLAGPGCDDDDADGFLDAQADCPDDLVRCTDITTQPDCAATKGCAWNATYCEGIEWDYASYVPKRWRGRMQDPQELSLGSGFSADKA